MTVSQDKYAKLAKAKEKIARLRQSFIEQLPTRLIEGKAALRLLAENHTEQTVANMHRFFHSIKGTSRSFGFDSLSDTILAGDDIANRLLSHHGALPADWMQVLEESLKALALEITKLTTQELTQHDAMSNLPYFGREQSFHQDDREARKYLYLCDDDALVTEQLSAQLGFFGYECRVFHRTDALQQAILQQLPSAIIMDINFPEGCNAGLELLENLFKQLSTPIPTVFLSAREDFAARLRSVQVGGSAYFRKPARVLDIVAMLDSLTTPKAPEPYRVIVVDDEPEIASYHAIILEQAGMVTEQISEPEQLLNTLASFRPDLVLMDMYMPCCTGRDLAKMMRQIPEYVSLPIVFLSSETDRQRQFSAMSVGAEGFLTKPVIPEYLVAAVAIRAERMRILRMLMAKDSLTGLYNHTTTTSLIGNELANAIRQESSLCLVMIDIDHFKRVNDEHGHPIGDQVLLAMSRVLQQRLRHADIVGRYGGEEFAIIMPATEEAQAMQVIDLLRQDFAQIIFNSPQGDFSCSFSAGVASYPRHTTIESLRAASDQALYRAKRQGRNQTVGELLSVDWSRS